MPLAPAALPVDPLPIDGPRALRPSSPAAETKSLVSTVSVQQGLGFHARVSRLRVRGGRRQQKFQKAGAHQFVGWAWHRASCPTSLCSVRRVDFLSKRACAAIRVGGGFASAALRSLCTLCPQERLHAQSVLALRRMTSSSPQISLCSGADCCGRSLAPRDGHVCPDSL